MFFRKFSIVLSVAALLGGCANSKIDFAEKLASAPVCCAGLADITYQPLAYDKSATQVIGSDKSQARNFKEGKSYFAAFALPAFTSPYELSVKSSPYGGSLLPPKVQLLDENFQLKEVIHPEKFQFSNGVLTHSAFVNTDRGYRYMLVYTDPAKLGGKKTARTTGNYAAPLTPGGFMLYTGYDEKSEMVVSSGGQVEVLVKTYAPRKLK